MFLFAVIATDGEDRAQEMSIDYIILLKVSRIYNG